MCSHGWEQTGTSFGETGAAFALTCPSFTCTIAIRMCVGRGHAFPAGALDTEYCRNLKYRSGGELGFPSASEDR